MVVGDQTAGRSRHFCPPLMLKFRLNNLPKGLENVIILKIGAGYPNSDEVSWKFAQTWARMKLPQIITAHTT